MCSALRLCPVRFNIRTTLKSTYVHLSAEKARYCQSRSVHLSAQRYVTYAHTASTPCPIPTIVSVYPILKSVRKNSLLPHCSITTFSPIPSTSVGVDQYYLPYPNQSAQNQASHIAPNFADGSGHLFSMYLEMATEEDKKMVENWKADADGILIFVRLSSNIVLLPTHW